MVRKPRPERMISPTRPRIAAAHERAVHLLLGVRSEIILSGRGFRTIPRIPRPESNPTLPSKIPTPIPPRKSPGAAWTNLAASAPTPWISGPPSMAPKPEISHSKFWRLWRLRRRRHRRQNPRQNARRHFFSRFQDKWKFEGLLSNVPGLHRPERIRPRSSALPTKR